MKIYYFPFAPNPTRLRIYLGEKDLKLDMELVNLVQGQQKSPEHLARNPLGKLPVLELDDGSYLSESAAIVEYLEEKFPDPPMIGTTAEERAHTRELDRLADIGVLIPFAKTVHATNSPLGLPPNPAAAQAFMSTVPDVLAILDAHLEQHAFLGGERPCIADCTLRAGYGFAEICEIEIPTGFSHVDRWREAIDARPSVQNL